MNKKLLTLLAAFALLISPTISPPAFAQIGQTATLTGSVTDASGAVLPGATVTVAGETLIGGTRSVQTDANGVYRFPALPPGAYKVNVELSGFKTISQDVRLQLGETITVDAKLEVGGVQESVTVTGESPVIDVKSSSSQKNLSEDIMENIPFSSRFGPGAMLVAPGVNPNNYSTYGSGGSSSNAYMIDGVDVSDPEGGTIWVFANHNWIQEVQVVSLGAAAEHGGFTGAGSNSLIRSGSNAFHGLFETLFENDSLTGTNTSDEILEQNPDLTSATTDYVTDTTVQVGGPIKRDKLWFFSSFQYYRPKTAPAGFPAEPLPGMPNPDVGPDARLEKSPRFIFKPTLRLTQNDLLTGYFQAERYDIEGRGSGARVAPEATVQEKAPGFSWNANYTKVLSASSVFDVRYSGFWGYYDLLPYNGETPGWYDVDEDFYGVNSYYFYLADRLRNQMNASVTKFASGFAGEHNLKFGAEFERSYIKSELGYPGDMYVFSYQLGGIATPYYAYLWDGYLQDDVNTRLAFFAQDSWTINNRLTINPGLRIDMHRGFSKDLDETVFKTNPIAPRIGFAWDIAGNSKTVVRGHYGWYYDGAKSTYYNKVDSNAPFFGAYIDEQLNIIGGPYQLTPSNAAYTVDDDIKHPRLKQAIIGIERELFPGFSLTANGIFRDNDQFIDDVIENGEFAPRVLTDPGPDGVAGTGDETSNTVTAYRRLSDPTEHLFLITNPEGAFREYRGFELVANKRFRDRWGVQASWVISKITGNLNNTSSFGNGGDYDNPNLDPNVQPFRTGRLTNDNTHLAKVLGMYQGPWDVMMSGAFYYTSGQTFTRTYRPASSLVTGRPDLFIEERGSQRYEGQPRFDIRLEKDFRFAGDRRIGVTLEGFNIFNDDAVTSRTTRSGSTYFEPQGLVQPRRFRIGAVYRF
jgi:hypothetical protein